MGAMKNLLIKAQEGALTPGEKQIYDQMQCCAVCAGPVDRQSITTAQGGFVCCTECEIASKQYIGAIHSVIEHNLTTPQKQ